MKLLLAILIFSVMLTSCDSPEDRFGTFIINNRDTVSFSYSGNLEIENGNLKDGNSNIKHSGVLSFSEISSPNQKIDYVNTQGPGSNNLYNDSARKKDQQ
jgi:hypothetical protein